MQKIILSQTENVGDVNLILSITGILKEMFPHCTIILLDNDYTLELVALSNCVDEFILKTD